MKRLTMFATIVLSACAAIGMIACVPAYASTATSTDQSDLWWNASESGWGMQMVQRGSIIFATLFAYDAINNPIWYSATLNYLGNLRWAGDLYLTAGPWFGAVPFNPDSVTNRKVGTIAWDGALVASGTVVYSVDGVSVTKNVVRQFLTYDNFAGTYLGAVHQTASGCFNPSNNGTTEEYAQLTVSQVGQSVSLATSDAQGSGCSLSGTLTQGGQFGRITGNFTCSSGQAGTFSLFELNVSLNALTGRYTTSSANFGCQTTGYLGGMRHR